MADVYQVEKIIGKKKMNGKVHYRIKWKGYPEEESTWEPRASCHCQDMIKAFEARLKKMQNGEPLESDDDDDAVEQPCHASLPYPVPAKVYKCGRVGDAKVKIAKVLGVQRYNGENIVMVRYVDDSLEIVPTAEVRKEDPEPLIEYYESLIKRGLFAKKQSQKQEEADASKDAKNAEEQEEVNDENKKPNPSLLVELD
ncbi:heterochromatin protein 1 [Aphelenchoides avenae]|nr:heterochromatin protein 1 [Aphelenchus avenae]